MKNIIFLFSLLIFSYTNTFSQSKPVKSPRIQPTDQKVEGMGKNVKDKALSLLKILDLNKDKNLSVEELSSASLIIKNLIKNIEETGKIKLVDIQKAIASQVELNSGPSNVRRPIAKKRSGGNSNNVSSSRPSLLRPASRPSSTTRSSRLSARKSKATRRVAPNSKSNVKVQEPRVPIASGSLKVNTNLSDNKPVSAKRPNKKVNSAQTRGKVDKKSLTSDLKELRDLVKSGVENKTWNEDQDKLKTATEFLKNIQKLAISIRSGNSKPVVSEMEKIRNNLIN